MDGFCIKIDRDLILSALKCCVHINCSDCPLSSNEKCISLLDLFLDSLSLNVKEIEFNVV